MYCMVATLLLIAGVACAQPADWWDTRWDYRVPLPANTIGPIIELDANFSVLLGHTGEFDPDSLRLVIQTAHGPAPAPLRFRPLPGYDPASSAVGRVTALVADRAPGTPIYLYFGTAAAGPWQRGPILPDDLPANERCVDGSLEHFGDEGSPWQAYGPGVTLTDDAHTGERALVFTNNSTEDASGLWQQVDLNRSRVFPLVISGWSRCEEVSGDPDAHYSLWADLQYTDGTFLYGQSIPFDTGTHDWQYRELTIHPAKPVRWIKLHGLLRRHSGRAWFDDLSVREVERYTLYTVERRQAAATVPAETMTIATGDGLELRVDRSTGAITGVVVGDSDWTDALTVPHSGLLLRDAAAGSLPLPLGGEIEQVDDGLRQTGALPGLGLEAQAHYIVHPNCIEVTGEVRDTTGDDRCVDVIFRLPIAADGRQWHRNLRESVDAAEPGTRSEAMRVGGQSVTRFPFCSLGDADEGLSLAIRMDEPATVTMSWDNTGDVSFLQVRFAFGLSPAAAKHPSRAPFRFYIYRHDGRWGFRAAAAKYYALFPEFFEVRAERQGCWFFGTMDPTTIPNPEDFGFMYDEGPHNVAWNRERGIYSFPTTNAQEMWVVVGDYDEPNPPPPPDEEVMQKLRERDDWPLELIEHCAIHDENGEIPWIGWHNQVWGGVAGRADRWMRMTYVNADPELPSLNVWDKRNEWYNRTVERFADQGPMDGLYIDQVIMVGAENYRRDHFATADRPLSYSERTMRPVLPVWMSSAEFHRAWSERIHSEGGLMMCNMPARSHIFYCALFDVIGSEVSPSRQTAADTDLRRVFGYQKPITLLLEWHWEGKPVVTAEDMEQYMNRCLFWGIFPGISNAGPEGGMNYWQHPELYERDRPTWRRYIPAIRTIATAGWEPIAYARFGVPHVWVERWGPDPEGRVYFTLRNEGETADDRLLVDLEPIGLAGRPLTARDLLTGEELGATRGGTVFAIPVTVQTGRSVAIAVEPAQ